MWSLHRCLVLHGGGRPSSPAAIASFRALGAQGIGTVRFGTTKAKAVAGLSDLLGGPTWQGVNSGCSPSYTEVEWGKLVAEFRLGTFSGYRYIKGGWPLTTPGSPRRALASGHASLAFATAKGISLGSTLGQVRLAYGDLNFAGVDKWRAANGTIFVVDALRDPEPSSSKVVEIKLGTCGDF